MTNSVKYQAVSPEVPSLGSVVPTQLAEAMSNALLKLKEALGNDVSGYVANRLRMTMPELSESLASEQVDGVALAMYNIEKRAQSVIIGDQTGLGKGRQAAAMIRYALLSGYLPIFFTDRYTLFSDMYRDCKALGIKDARPLIVNAGVSVVDFDCVVEKEETAYSADEIWSPNDSDEESEEDESALMQLYQNQYEVVFKSPNKKVLQDILTSGDIPSVSYDYLMITYSQLKDARRDRTRLDFLHSLCEKHRVLFIFDEAHRSSSVSVGKPSVITQGINLILTETPQTQCVFLSATFAKRPESLITFMRRTALNALATESTLEKALHSGGVPMQEYVSSCLASEGQMIRREHSSVGIPTPVYTYLEDELVIHGDLFDKVMYYFRELVKLSTMVREFVALAQMNGYLLDFSCYPTRAQLFYINKVVLLSLKAQRVAQVAIDEVKQGRCVVIGMSDTLECVLRDVVVSDDGIVRGDFSSLLLRLLDKTVTDSIPLVKQVPVFDIIGELDDPELIPLVSKSKELKDYYKYILHSIKEDIFHLPMSPIDVIRQLITRESFVAPDGSYMNIRFEECTGRAHQLEYLSPDGDDDFIHAAITSRKKRHSNHIFNDFQNNKLDVILINACGSIGASAHAISTSEVPDDQVRQRKMLIVQNDLDVNIDLQKRGRINRTGQRMDLPPLYEYIITAIPSEKRLNMMLRSKLRSLSANTAAWQDQDREQADFVDISNKYGNEVASDYLQSHKELACLLGLTGKVTASKLLARLAMLSVTAQQDIVDDLLGAYTTLEAELRRINQWDLEREFRDFEAEFVREELFTTSKADSKLGGCSYLTTYQCRQKTFPYSYDTLMNHCEEAYCRYGAPYTNNTALQKQVRDYYAFHNKEIRARFQERHRLLYGGAKRMLIEYCHNEDVAKMWLQKACTPYNDWPSSYFEDVESYDRSKQILRKLISYSNEFNHLLEREKKSLKKYADEKKRLIHILSNAVIGNSYSNICAQVADEENTGRVIAVLCDIRFGKDTKSMFLPSKVELVFALSAVHTEISINLVHNKKWSNYQRIVEILDSERWKWNEDEWTREISSNNNKVIERKIITGNILGAFVHPAIALLKPRFITFSVKEKKSGAVHTQPGLLLPLDESKLRDAIKNVSIPLHEGLKYASNTNSTYIIAGLEVTFSLLPYRLSDSCVKYVLSVQDNCSKLFEENRRYDEIRTYFACSQVTSMYDKDDKDSVKKKRRVLKHFQTEQLDFDSVAFQSIVQALAQMDAVIIVPRDQLTYSDAEEFASRSEHAYNEPWAVLNWQNSDEVPIPPIKEKILLRISSPLVKAEKRGTPVLRFSEVYLLAQETMALNGLPLSVRSTTDALRRTYMKWKAYYTRCYVSARNRRSDLLPICYPEIFCRELLVAVENRQRDQFVSFNDDMKEILQGILDSEYLDINGEYMAKFDEEMLFQSPEIWDAQQFLGNMPCSPVLDSIRHCVQDYIDGKSEIINSPDEW